MRMLGNLDQMCKWGISNAIVDDTGLEINMGEKIKYENWRGRGGVVM